MSVALSTNLRDPDAIPYFLWDEPMTVASVRERLRNTSSPEATRLLGKILREARDTEVWLFTTPAEVFARWDELPPTWAAAARFGNSSWAAGGRRGCLGNSRLTRLQQDLLEAFFRRESRFFLTGGAALAGFYLGHRDTADLDLFTTADLLADGVLVDLVRERAPQGGEAKRQFGFVWVDPPGEILANKLCALLSRAELRDLVEVLALERAGFRVEEAVPLAVRNDAGLTPGQLGWVLSQITIGDDAEIPGGASPAELRSFLSELIACLTRLAFPRTAP